MRTVKTKPARYRPPRRLSTLQPGVNTGPGFAVHVEAESAFGIASPSDRCGTVAPGDFDGMDHALDALPYLTRGRR